MPKKQEECIIHGFCSVTDHEQRYRDPCVPGPC